MANTYSQIHLQLIFAVKHREALIKNEWKDEIEKYICGIIIHNRCKPLAIYCNPDHTHIFLGFRPGVLISDLVKTIKTSSNALINERFCQSRNFGWQDGYGVFSYSYSQIDAVVRYVMNQAEHHKKRMFRDEYIDMLRKSNIDFDDKYLFDFFD
ncbi:MAG: IS200/IS605 family transposase [Candidatus Symbiothrix sp.]|jgi:REP element-mobilizing transposase RayT|nr:IS200/IS605 family transposase [Candidatus Symbiothrix sp.]